jgi:hypothetical protein
MPPSARRRPAQPGTRTKGKGKSRKVAGDPSRQSQGPGRTPSSSGRRRAEPGRRRRAKAEWARLAPVYDVDGPRIRYGVAWFVVALPALLLSPGSASLLYGVAAGWAARQVVQAWRGQSWQADLSAILAGLTVVAASGGLNIALLVGGAAAVAAVVAGLNAPSAGLRGPAGHVASAGIMLAAVVPVAVAGASMVLLRSEASSAAFILLVLVSAYEMGDYLVGSGASNPIEGPLAGGAALIVTGIPMALLLIEPFDVMGVALLGVAALCCPVGQWIASAILPRPDAHAPALRRLDTLLLLAPLWVVAAGVI